MFEGIALVAGVDRIFDMGCTGVSAAGGFSAAFSQTSDLISVRGRTS